ncbi:hypothetical protein [Shewanella cyperi]|uniref:hypothetical protein n=1 Tax=Shewanella cyperi TaxID=2814292 RepID=UPI001A93BF1A|nr:hypothetical protein [Shewanella cyperi]QSX40585.1 hypothetical protein JYB84_16795 [Shewanella cyperi]
MNSSCKYLLLLVALTCGSALADKPIPASVTVGINGHAASNSGAPADNTGYGVNIKYAYTLNAGGAISDNLPIEFCLTAETDTDTTPASSSSWTSFSYDISLQSASLPGASAPVTTVVFNNGALGTLPACQTIELNLSTGPLTEGTFDANFKINRSEVTQDGDKLKVNDDHNNIKIDVEVLASDNNISCFMTDGSGLLLADCQGQAVTDSASDAGRFAVVTNKKGIGVSTNPGQFYYNLVLHNPSQDEQNVDVSFALSELVPQGAQAIHAAVFPPSFSGITQENFETVNASLPGGSDDLIEGLVIPPGWTLWVDYHLEWSGKGELLDSNCTNNCADANNLGVPVEVTANLSGDVTGVCSSGAWGFRKK